MSFKKQTTLTFAILSLLSACAPESGKAANFECCTEAELAYANGDVELAATLLSPKGDGPYPAVVMLQGSGDSGRDNQWSGMVARMLVEKGFAVLWTDKRGSGSSGGDWRTSDFEDLALDALAGIEAIRDFENVDPDNIGLIGLSQGGHVASLAASLGEVDFVINFVGSSVPMKDTLIHELEQTYRQFGLDEPAIEFLQGMTYASFKYIETGEGWDEYLAIRTAVEDKFGRVAVESWPDTRDNWYWIFWGGIHDFDPMPYWKVLTEGRDIPVFIAYGELDEFDNVPVKASVARFQEALSSDNLTVNVYAGTGHSLLDQGKMAEGKFQFVTPLLDDLDVWVAEYVRNRGN